MRKQTVILVSLVLLLALFVAACGGAAEEPAPAPTEAPAAEAPAAEEPAAEEPSEEMSELKIWSFTNEIMTMATAYEGANVTVDTQYTMIPMTAGEYQTKLKAALGHLRCT